MPNSIAYNMDCQQGMKMLESNSIDLVVTSPPYDDLRQYGGYYFDWHTVIHELYRVTKPGGIVVWIVADQTKNGSETGTSFKQALYAMECGFNLHDTMIWEKDSCGFPESNRYSNVFEYMFVFSKGRPNTFCPITDRKNKCAGTKLHGTDRQRDGTLKPDISSATVNDIGARFNVWNMPCEKCNDTGHPAVFPLKLVKDHILTWSRRGDMVLDPFLGSGTTRLACYDLDRDFIGFEINQIYFDKQEQRFADYTAQVRISDLLNA